MKVNIIAITDPKINGIKTCEEFLGYVARVSNPSNQMNTETMPRLIKYLMKNGHWSPFELINVTLEIETTRDIARQILRHRSFSFQEFSQRYADPTKSLGFVSREPRKQDPKNRQNSIDFDESDVEVLGEWNKRVKNSIERAQEDYEWAVENNIAKEQARSFLPEGLTSSRLYMAGTLRSWIHYIQTRSANGTQKEHMEIAQLIEKELRKHFPSVFEAIDEIRNEPKAQQIVTKSIPIKKVGFFTRIKELWLKFWNW